MKKLIFLFLIFSISAKSQNVEHLADKSDVIKMSEYRTEIDNCKMTGTQLSKRTRIAEMFFGMDEAKTVWDVRRFQFIEGKFYKRGFSKVRMFKGFSFTAKTEGIYFVLIQQKDKSKNRVLKVDVSESEFVMTLFAKGNSLAKRISNRNEVERMSESEIPDFSKVKNVKGKSDFWGCELRNQKFVSIKKIRDVMKKSEEIEVTYFYRKDENSNWVQVVDSVKIKVGQLGLHVPFKGTYFTVAKNENGIFYYRLIAKDESGKGSYFFKK